jgi:hypothetical protein
MGLIMANIYGSAANQISTNGDLGTAAFVDVAQLVSKTSDTGAAILPVGTTAQRDAGTVTGYLRYNSTLTQFEGYGVGGWGKVGGGATGGGTDAIFYLNGQTVTADFTVPIGQNAGSFGTITIANTATVTVPDGSTWSTT